jgi:predicted nucleotidyltransferase
MEMFQSGFAIQHLSIVPSRQDLLIKDRENQNKFDSIIEFFISLNPSKIILFGSQARGDSTKDSDYDFLLVFRDKKPSQLDLVKSDVNKVRRKLPCDVLITTKKEYVKLSESKFHVYGKAKSEGVVLYEES